jgi:gluconate 2-dehydrogenase gamma chain
MPNMIDPMRPGTPPDWVTAEELGTDILERPDATAQAVPASSVSALSEAEFSLLEAIAARVFPTTDTPGAWEAGAAHYVNIALAGAYASSLPRYHRGLADLERHCTDRRGASFLALSEADQDEVLRALQAGQIADVADGPEFFALARRHILEGVFCEPTYGGNRGLVGWSLVGFPGQRYGYADPYINRVIDLPPVAVDGPPGPEDC